MAERKRRELLGKPERSRKPDVVTGRNDSPAERKRKPKPKPIAENPAASLALLARARGRPR